MPDSITINMIDPSLLPGASFKARLGSEATLTCRNTLKILNTIRAVTRAFTVMDMARLLSCTGYAHSGIIIFRPKEMKTEQLEGMKAEQLEEMKAGQLDASHVARVNKLE